MVRAKFFVSSLTQSQMGHNGEIGTTVNLSPVIIGSEENKDFYKWTPSGRIELGTLNPKAAEQFEIGKEYYVEFTPAD